LPEGTAETTDIFEIMHTMRAKPDPVPDEVIRKILLAGQAAANGGNTQRWRFLVLKNHPGKKVVQGYYKKLFDEVVGPAIATARRPRIGSAEAIAANGGQSIFDRPLPQGAGVDRRLSRR
jgi:nitroreductase